MVQPLVLNRTRILRTLWISGMVIVLASLGGYLILFTTGHDSVYGMIHLFDLDSEGNIPSFFSALILLLVWLTIGLISELKRASRAAFAVEWAVLSYAFLYLALDEITSIHELFTRPTQKLLGGLSEHMRYSAWVIPAMIVVAAGLFWMRRFLRHLPRPTVMWLVLAAGLYLGGAVGVEFLGGDYAERHGTNWIYYLMVAAEEGLEMSGAIVFLHAMLAYLEEQYREVRMEFGRSSPLPGPAR